MDILKTFESLSESDQFKFIKLLESGRKETFIDQNETPEASNSEGSNLSGFLKNLKIVLGENSSESNLKGENSKKKQKTLDGWLIKLDNGSSPKNKVEHASSKGTVQSSLTSHSSNVPEVSSHSGHTAAGNGKDQNSLDIVTSGSQPICENSSSHSGHTAADNGKDQNSLDIVTSVYCSQLICENSRIVERPDMHINVPIKNIEADNSRAVERTKLTNEKYNLRRSKRKACELSPIEDIESNVKHFKSTDNHLVVPSISDHDRTSDNTLTNLDSLSHRLTVVNKGNSNMGTSFEKKNCNKRTKRKNSKLLQSLKTNNSSTVQAELNREVRHKEINKNKLLLNISSPPKSKNYEAFCLLSNKCSKVGLNIMDILQHKNIQTLLSNKKNLSDDAIIFIGSCETQSKEMKPVVHVAKSKKRLHEKLMELRK